MQDFSNPAGCIERFTIDRGNKKTKRERGRYIGASELRFKLGTIMVTVCESVFRM